MKKNSSESNPFSNSSGQFPTGHASPPEHAVTRALTPEPTATQAPTSEPTSAQVPTPEPTATQVPTPEPTVTQVPTPEPVATNTPTPEPTATKAPTHEPVVTNTPTPEPTATKAPTPMSEKDSGQIVSGGSKRETDKTKTDLSLFTSIGLIGDSYTAGVYSYYTNGEEKTDHDVSLSWGNILATKYGLSAKNYGWGGATIKKWLEVPNSLKESFDKDEICDVYTIAFGINDKNKTGVEKSKYDPAFWYKELGSPEDKIGSDSFYGYLKEICEYVHAKAPSAPIFIITPYKYYKGWNEAIRYMSDLYDYVYIADIYQDCPYYVGDGSGYFMSHPTIEGHKMLAEYFEKIFNSIIYNNHDAIIKQMLDN